MLLAAAALGKRVGDTMADFQVVKWQSAETMKLEDFKGRIVILLFFNPVWSSSPASLQRFCSSRCSTTTRAAGAMRMGFL